MTAPTYNFYQVGASLPVNAQSYVKRLADEEFYQKLKAGKFCYVLNCRQMGKSSLRVQTMQRLQAEGTVCAVIDLTGIGKHKVTIEQWYGGIFYALVESCQLEDTFDWQTWWQKQQEVLSPVQCLSLFIQKVLLVKIQQPIVIFVDEIDRVLSQDFSLDDFFALIRFFQNQRVDNPDFERLTFALLGVATPNDLITDKSQTPFNIGEGIELHGFQLHEVQPLIAGLQGRFNSPQEVIKEILYWTGGQPFLTQKLCSFMVEESEKENPRTVEQVVRSRIIDNWESQDEPEHLRTIRDRILRDEQMAPYLLELYQQIQQHGEISTNNNIEISELQLSGLVVKQHGKLRVYSPIYKHIFDQKWIKTKFKNLRPYSENFRFWLASGGTDKSRLLRGKALQDTLKWAKDKNLNYQDKQFLAASQTQEREEKIAALEKEAQLERERKDREAVEKRNLVLDDANKKAQKRITLGTVALLFTLTGVLISGKIAVTLSVESQNNQREIQDQKQNIESLKDNNKTLQKNKNELQVQIQSAEKENTIVQNNLQSQKQVLNSTERANKELEQQKNNFKYDLNESIKKLEDTQEKQKKAETNYEEVRKQLSKTEEYLTKTEELVKLAGKLTDEGLYPISEELFSQAGQSAKIKDHNLRQAILELGITVGYLNLPRENSEEITDDLKKANNYFDKIKINDEDDSEEGLQIRILYSKTQGNLFVKEEKYVDAVNAYKEAFTALNILKKKNTLKSVSPPFNQNIETKILSSKNVEALHKEFISLTKRDNIFKTIERDEREVKESLKEHYFDELNSYLINEKWGQADLQTTKLIFYIAEIGDKATELILSVQEDKKEKLLTEIINNVGCEDLRKINNLWVDKSKGKFGFTIQIPLYIEAGNIPGKYDENAFLRFAEKVKWQKKTDDGGFTISLGVNDNNKGHYPMFIPLDTTRNISQFGATFAISLYLRNRETLSYVFGRVEKCNF
ncbi:AAA-like domain-containing protein [Nostocaceae cyanobacterium CENA357]|uniref:AAA-like domain-containing protein n=1 Tax=Atlanticothrix silvestris CENA357 TaxID=1725252 RepID=A0A8J7L1N3_9CYAN|nr:AAA-like domain-containing protein [Atlanticothrix silvestris]MBH8553580.1 AAA-like domain-containing protein [Atlanticothrix silvestris CENA357]